MGLVLPPATPIRLGDDDDHSWRVPFFEGAQYEESVARPEDFFDYAIGSRIAGHAEMLAVLRAIAATSERVTLESYGRTFEGRELVTLTITSPENHARMAEIKRNGRALFDPRGVDAAGMESLIAGQPGVAWMGYGIHGDETSASEAAVPFVYHLAACTDASIVEALSRTVVVLDPCLNPDGRERIRTMVEQSAGFRANLDSGAMQRGRWPGGRGNHYLFDMNRDWMAGETPETRGRWSRLLELPPQLFVDAHEMSGLDTFLFYPQTDPRNAYLPERLTHWQTELAGDAARVFDQFGWGYYTREWADALYPGYSDAWGSLTGAIGMLYEQGRTIGAPLRRESGEIVPYRETVHGQIAVSLSNLLTFAENKNEILQDYVAHRRWAIDEASPLGGRAFAVVPPADVMRGARFLRTLLGQGIEVEEANAAFEATDVVGWLGSTAEKKTLPEGTWIVRAAQPQGGLVRGYLDFDQRLDEAFLKKERELIERGEGSKIYDVTGWDLGRQFGVESYWINAPEVDTSPATELRAPTGLMPGSSGAYAWIASGADERSLGFAARVMELGGRVHVSDRDFRAQVIRGDAGETVTLGFPRGSFLLRRHENPENVEELIRRGATSSGAVVHSTLTGRSNDDGPDLGGGHFQLLELPKVALFSNSPASRTDFGHVWSYLDQDLSMPVTLVDAQGYRGVDLAEYNVLIAPPGLGPILRDGAGELLDWVKAGGTLIAIGSAAHSLADPELGFSENRRRRDALDSLEAQAWMAELERRAEGIEIDLADLYGQEPGPAGDQEGANENAPSIDAGESSSGGGDSSLEAPSAEALDRYQRKFSPEGVILRGRLDPASWITSGVAPSPDIGREVRELAVPFAGSSVLLPAVRPAVRLAEGDRLRLAGLLWPEARERISGSAWLTVERKGRGQVISFADSPVFRGSWRATSRLFGNAVLLGPGMTD